MDTKRKKIKDLPLSQRPREKLLATGRENLSNAELLAILFGTGTVKQNVILLAESLLRKYPMHKLQSLPMRDLISHPGIGNSKASRLVAALELGERLYAQSSLSKTIVATLEDAVREMKEFTNKQQEYLVALYLNARNQLIQKEIVGIGSLNSLRIEPKDIFRHALTTPCASLIVAHNHPSGDPTPSDDDIAFTKRLFEAGEVMGIPLIDHVILTKNKYFSFREFRTTE